MIVKQLRLRRSFRLRLAFGGVSNASRNRLTE